MRERLTHKTFTAFFAAVLGSVLLIGTGAGADPVADVDGNNISAAGDNQVNAQVCHNQVPVNALGVQVPVQEIDSALGLGLLNDGSDSTTAQDEQCNAESAQQNSSNAEDDS